MNYNDVNVAFVLRIPKLILREIRKVTLRCNLQTVTNIVLSTERTKNTGVSLQIRRKTDRISEKMTS